jgi:hypothetical protein
VVQFLRTTTMANATLIIDTNGIVNKLEQRGFSRTQAEGITEALKELDTSVFGHQSGSQRS